MRQPHTSQTKMDMDQRYINLIQAHQPSLLKLNIPTPQQQKSITTTQTLSLKFDRVSIYHPNNPQNL